ncbi:MAG: GEVED domain-containing protein [Flavobacteriaceae bacterium]
MIKKYSLVLIALLCSFFYGFGQVTIFSENIGSGTGTQSIAATTFQNSGTLSYAGTADTRTSTPSSGYTGSSGGKNVFITNVSGRYFEISAISTVGYTTLTLSFGAYKSTNASNMSELALEYSIDGIAWSPITIPSQPTGTGTANWRLISGISLPGTAEGVTTLHLRWTNNNSPVSTQFRIDDVLLEGTISCSDEVDFANIQFPTTSPQTITVGNTFNVYTQAFEPGVTPNAGQDPNIEAWIGYSTSNTDPSTWTDWVPATYNVQAGNNDEYVADLGAVITVPGTYYYASRYRLNGCGFSYGGTGGNWNNDSVQLIVEPDQVDFCNVDYPKNGSAIVGGNFNVYAQAYEPGVTNAVGQGANIEAWIGYNTIGINHQPWSASGWTWVPATYDSDFGNNDVYVAEICNSQSLTANTYYFASRFRLNGSEFSYGGIQADNVGNFWDTTNNNGTLIVYNNPNNATNFIGCFTDSGVDLTWSAPASGTTPDGYVVFAIEGATAPAGTKGDASTYTANADFSIAPTITPATLGKVVYKGTGTSASIIGLTENTNYSFAVFAYKLENGTGWSTGSGGSRILNGLAQDDVSNLVATPLTNQVTLNWNNPLPTSCFDELIIVANQGTVSFTPATSTTYAPLDVNYTTGNSVVYATTSTVSSKAINGLANGLNYCFKIFIRRGSVWSDGVEVCATPILTYCDATSNVDAFNTGITGVVFNTINNTGTSPNNTYVDYTAISTNVLLGESYDISVNVNVDGNGTVYSRAWIDWNLDGDFNDSNEEYDLGTLYNPSGTIDLDGATSESPFSIEVPTTASIGSTRMRVAAKWNAYPTSCEDNYSGEIEDYTIIISQPSTAEINVKSNNITIPNGFNAPYGLNNTLFGATDLAGPYTEKSYFISNLGLTTLNLTNNPIVEIIGTNPGDFIVTQQPSANSIASGGSDLEFRIEFRPTSSGLREAQVRIYNNDSTGSENPYIFDIQGTGTCSTTITTSMWPIEGPEDTEVTITSATNLTGATATINGLTMPVVSNTAGELVVTVPNGAEDGNIVILFSTGCASTQSFDVIDQVISSCEGTTGATTPTDLFMSEITDATTGSSTLIEIYNGTGATVNLSNYSLKIYNNGSLSASSTSVLSGNLVDGGIYVVSVGTTSCTFNNISAGINLSFNAVAGINFETNKADAIVLEKTSGTGLGEKDVFGVKGSGTWANGLSFGEDGVNFRRKVTSPNLPSLTFSLADWDIIDWTNCSDSDYVNIGLYDFSLGVPPTINTHPNISITNCDAFVDLTVDADEGFIGGLYGLVYTWFYLAPNSNTWTEITGDGGPYSGYNQATLRVNFNDVLDVNGYQYYCQVRENSNTCYTSTKAVKINHERSYWNGSAWSSIPDISKLAVINGAYNTGTNGNIDSCELVINSGNTLTVSNTTYVNVINNVTNYGTIDVLTRGSFVQRGDGVAAGTFTNSGAGTANVHKTTATFNSTLSEVNYTYWSSPVNDPSNPGFGQDIITVFPSPVGNRRYYFMAQNYIDSFIETGNNNDNTTNPGQDDIDDNGNDWQMASGDMEIGRGYAVTTNGVPPMPGNYFDASTVFSGALNTGDIAVTLYKNNNEINDNNWNFIGNPYPSAISVDDFFSSNIDDVPLNPAINGLTEGAIFLWSQSVAPDAGNNGNEQVNFAQSDYAIINRVASTAGTSGITPLRYIPSGQGFFVAFTEDLGSAVNSVTTGTVVFTNSMRRTSNNTQFFEANNSTQDDMANQVFDTNILWLNMSSDNGVFSQIAVAYTNGATNSYDGWSYDTPRNLSTGTYATLYSTIDSSDRKFAIQGKNPESLTVEEIIPLGFDTSINEATLYKFSIAQFEGNFMSENDIFIKDHLLNKIHNLKESDYSFTSEVGEFTDRFEIVFTRETLSIDDVKPDVNSLQIIELQNGHVQFKVSSQFEMKSIEIIDLLGRTLYKFDAEGNSQTYSLSNLSQATYLAKVELTNGHIITKKAIKRR